MTASGNDLLIRALLRRPVPRTPVWIMRQAGRYLPEYREVRTQAGDFMTLCRTPELACEVTLQPLRRFDLDAAILFSDILTVPDAMGLGLHFVEGEGPRFREPVTTPARIRQLAVPDVADKLGYVFEAVELVKRELDGRVPLIGFAGSPWTVATYMVEGGSSREFTAIRALAAEEPALLERLLDLLARAITDYLNAQIESGADAVMIFDTWGGMLPPDDYRRFSLAFMQQVVDGLARERDARRIPVILFTKGAGTLLADMSRTGCDALGVDWTTGLAAARERDARRIPVILFTKGAGTLLADMSRTGCDALGVDWTTDLAAARELTEDRVALQGNLEPAILKRSPAEIEENVARVLESYGRGPGHVFNLGHGITPDVDPENVQVMIDAVRRLSPEYHR